MTSPPTRREQRKAETRQRIYDVAMNLFRERGFDGTNVGDIVQAARVSVPTFYAYFPTKESLLLTLPTAQDVRRFLGTQPPAGRVVDRVRGAITPWFGHFTGPARAELLDRWRIVAGTPGLRARAAEFERTTAMMVVDALPPEDRRAAEVTVSALMAAYTQILLRWAEADGTRELEDVAEEVFATLAGL